ncbi:MAG: tyrosine-type recombinase/integrase [Candidatus Bathyarchaeia archaeon]
MTAQIHCPQCGSTLFWKDGMRHLTNGTTTQRYICRKCGHRFSEPKPKTEKQNDRSILLERAPLTLEAQIEKRDAGATEKPSEAELQGKIIEFLWWMKRQGYKETTIRSKGKRLQVLVKLGANLLDPENVKDVIALQDWDDSSKETTVHAYDSFAKWVGLKWDKPKYKAVRKLPFIPLEREIDDLIAGCNGKIATFLQIIKETGARAGEVFNLKWMDIDFENRTIKITPEKGSNPRIFNFSKRLLNMLEGLPKRSERVFDNKSLNSLRRIFERNRKRVAYKLGNPRILKISFHTLRHWKATMEYHKTKDILHVMQVLGHRNIKNTLVYTQLVKGGGEDEYVCKVAKTIEQAAELIEAGFDYVCEIDGVKLFRKRK